MRSQLSHTVNSEALVSLCQQFDNASNTVEMTRALFSFISLVDENTFSWHQYSPFARKSLTVQRSGVNPRQRVTYLGVDQPFYMHLLEMNKRKGGLLAEVCQGYEFHDRTSVDPNIKWAVYKTSEFDGVVNQWVLSVDLERLLEPRDIIALYLLQHNVIGSIEYPASQRGGSAFGADSLGFFQASQTAASQGQDVEAIARQLLYQDLIQFQLDNPDVGSLDRVKIVPNFPLKRCSSVCLAADVCASLVYFDDGSKFRSLSNYYKAKAVTSGQVSGGVIATEFCGMMINDNGIFKGTLADKIPGMDNNVIKSQSYAHGRYISISDLCRILIRGIDIALLSDDDIQSEIANRLKKTDEFETEVSLVQADIRVGPFSKSKRYSSAEIKQKEMDSIRSFRQIEHERARQEGLERAVQLRKKGSYSSALTGSTSQLNQQGHSSSAVASNAVSMEFNQGPSLFSGSGSSGFDSSADADGELSHSNGGSEVLTPLTEQNLDSPSAAASSVSSRLDQVSPLFSGSDFPQLGSSDSESDKTSSKGSSTLP